MAAPTGSGRSPASSHGRREGARGAADLDGEDQRPPRRRARRGRRSSHCAALSPKVMGTACWVRVRATIGVARCASTRPASRRTCVPQLRRRVRSTASRAHIISAVSSTSWLVRPRCSHRAASGLRSRRPSRSSAHQGRSTGSRRARTRSRATRGRRARPGRPGPPWPRPPARCPVPTSASQPRVLDGAPSPRGTSRPTNRSPARSSPGQSRSVMGSVSRMGEEDGLALALQPDVEHEPVLVGARHQRARGGPRRPRPAAGRPPARPAPRPSRPAGRPA